MHDYTQRQYYVITQGSMWMLSYNADSVIK